MNKLKVYKFIVNKKKGHPRLTPRAELGASQLGRYQSNPGMDHWRAVKKVMRYVQETKDYMLMYRQTNNLDLVGYSDVDFVGYIDSRKSTYG